MNSKLYDKLVNYDFKSLFAKKHYAYFTDGSYNMNIIGVRAKTNPVITNKFDDFIILDYKNESGKWCRQIYKATTDPGITYLKTPIDFKGCAMMVPGQYRGLWRIGLHRGKYKALVQRKPVSVYRDGNKNDVYDLEPTSIQNGLFGINIHRSNEAWTRNTIDQYSAGCQVFNNPTDFLSFLRLCEKQKAKYGNSFTYTLINETDLK